MIHNIFEQIDADHSGFIQFAELIDSLDHEGSGHTHIVSLLAYPWPTEILEVFLRVVPQMENEDMQHYTQKILPSVWHKQGRNGQFAWVYPEMLASPGYLICALLAWRSLWLFCWALVAAGYCMLFVVDCCWLSNAPCCWLLLVRHS